MWGPLEIVAYANLHGLWIGVEDTALGVTRRYDGVNRRQCSYRADITIRKHFVHFELLRDHPPIGDLVASVCGSVWTREPLIGDPIVAMHDDQLLCYYDEIVMPRGHNGLEAGAVDFPIPASCVGHAAHSTWRQFQSSQPADGYSNVAKDLCW